MAASTSNRNYCKETRNCKRNQDMLSDETALRDEILELKRQVMVLRRTNEQNLVKFRKYENEVKRKDREIEQLMDPRKNADVTKVLSTKGAAILMTLKDQNNALIQMVLNKDVQIRRLLAEIKMSKLYASTRKNVSYKEEIQRLKNLLAKSQEKLKENLDKENEEKTVCGRESLFFEFSSSSGQSSPRDLDELRLVIRSLEAHLKYSTDLLNRKDQEISVLADELNFLKKLLQHKAPKTESFDSHPIELHKYSSNDSHSVSQTRVSDIPEPTKLSGAELLQLFEKSANVENNFVSSSAPGSSTRLPSLNGDFISKHKSLSNITGNERKGSIIESVKISKTEATLLHGIAVGEDSNKADVTSKSEKTEKVKERKKILNKYKKGKKRIPKKFSGNAKKKKFCENEKRISDTFVLKAFESKEKEKKPNSEITSEICKIIDSKESEVKPNIEEIFSKSKNSESEKEESRTSTAEAEEFKATQSDRTNATVDCDMHCVDKEPETPKSRNSEANEIKDSVSGCSSEIIEMTLASKQGRCEIRNEETKSFNSRRQIYRQSFDSSFESENSYPMNQQVQQVQVEVQINSISVQDDGDESGNSIWEDNHSGKFTETRKGNCAPDNDDDDDDNNDDDNDVIIR